jgi:hypothetical protein
MINRDGKAGIVILILAVIILIAAIPWYFIIAGNLEADGINLFGSREAEKQAEEPESPPVEEPTIPTIKEDDVTILDSQVSNYSNNTIELAQLIGQTSDDVLQLLGQPEVVRNLTHGVETWYFGTLVGTEGYPGIISIHNNRVYNVLIAFDYESEFTILGIKCFTKFIEAGDRLENLGFVFSSIDEEFYNDGVMVFFLGDINGVEVMIKLDAFLYDYTSTDPAAPSITIYSGDIFAFSIFDRETFMNIHGGN